MFFKKPRHRVFDYTPRFYKPEEDKRDQDSEDKAILKEKREVR